MRVDEFDFDLPPELIAQTPAERGRSRLLVLDRSSGATHHTSVSRLPEWLRAGDVLVFNDSRVIPARLLGRRHPSGGRVECLLLHRLDAGHWDALVHPGQKLRPGERIVFGEGEQVLLEAEVVGRHGFGRRTLALRPTEGADLDAIIDRIGHVPLPPYIKREDRETDRGRYQTVYARERGSVAAPTAGLHFTHELLAQLERQGVLLAPLTLHVGYGTFKPVRTTLVEEHSVDPESYALPATTADLVNAALDEGRRIVAVGTTTTRVLEDVARRHGGRLVAGAGETSLFLHPGVEFGIVGALVTNFHVPRSSLLMLVAGFAGRERVLAAYAEGVREGYRFYSYGDAMLII